VWLSGFCIDREKKRITGKMAEAPRKEVLIDPMVGEHGEQQRMKRQAARRDFNA